MSPRLTPERVAIVSAGVALLVVAGSIATTVALNRSAAEPPSPTEVQPTVLVNGMPVPYAGRMPWYGAVRSATDDRALTIHANGDAITGPIFVCNLPAAERVVVHETARWVSMEAVGYANPLPDGFDCAGVGHGLQPLRVRLRHPLGDRSVRDAVAGAARRVLDRSLLPAPRLLPAGFTEDPDSPRWVTGWDMLSRTWRNGRIGSPHPQTIAVRVGDGATPGYFEPDGPPAATTTVQGRLARVWQDGNDRTPYWRVDIRWTTPDHLPALLHYEATADRHLSLRRIVAVAQSLE